MDVGYARLSHHSASSHAGSNRVHRGPDPPRLADLPDVPRPGVQDGAPPLGPFRTFQVPIRDIAAPTKLDLTQMTAADRIPVATARPAARLATNWRSLHSPEDLDLNARQ